MSRQRTVKAYIVLPTENLFDSLPEAALGLEDYGIAVKDLIAHCVELWAVINDCSPYSRQMSSSYQAMLLRELGELAAIQNMVETELVGPMAPEFLSISDLDNLILLLVEISALFYMEIDRHLADLFNLGSFHEVQLSGWLRHDLILKVMRCLR